MALQLEKQTVYGVIGDYHRITSARFTAKEKLMLEVCVYASEQARLDNKEPLALEQHQFDASYAELENKSIVKLGYEKLKALPQYQGCVDT